MCVGNNNISFLLCMKWLGFARSDKQREMQEVLVWNTNCVSANPLPWIHTRNTMSATRKRVNERPSNQHQLYLDADWMPAAGGSRGAERTNCLHQKYHETIYLSGGQNEFQ